MTNFWPYVHNIDPVIGTILGVHLWWYGLSYSLGFLNAHLFLKRRRRELSLSVAAIYDLSLLLASGVLIGGRAVEVIFYEWHFYAERPELIPAFWLGGMASHGLIAGGIAAVWLFCRLHGVSFLRMTDALSIPGAFILGVGRIGNFIDGQIVGSVTDAWWAVKFPDIEGFRHPVVIYDGLKNLLIIPILWYAGIRKLPAGAVTGIFLFLYAFLRIFIDVFREYPTSLMGLATGQFLNILTSAIGLALIVLPFWIARKRGEEAQRATLSAADRAERGFGWRTFAFAAILLFSLTIPSDWTQDIPERYGHRHVGLTYTALYPKIHNPPENQALIEAARVPEKAAKAEQPKP
jgi:phosphatidylglycerol:prolipoprotein diacylglycerol transferase